MAWICDNNDGVMLLNRVSVHFPKVALAYSLNLLTFESNALKAGKQHVVICNGISLTVTLDAMGSAKISLLPFIRQAVLESGAMNDPLSFESVTDQTAPNKMRGQLTIQILKEGLTTVGNNDENVDQTISPFFIFGDYSPMTPKFEFWRTYDSDNSTPMNYDDDDIYSYNAGDMSQSGIPTNLTKFQNNWKLAIDVKGTAVTGDFTMTRTVCTYSADTEIFRDVTWHFAYDCRTENVMKVRWLDHEGNINQRKLTIGSVSNGGSIGESWNTPHDTKELVNDYDVYWHGADLWQNIMPQKTITLGDDAIPINQYEWLKELATTPVVMIKVDNIWQRCNITGSAIECDPRKSTFSISITLTAPTYEVQQF